MEYSICQETAITEFETWYHRYKQRDRYVKQYFYLAGLAGSGKTSIIPEMLKAVGLSIDDFRVLFGSFTGKAAMVMRSKGMTSARTLHSLCYTATEDEHGNLKFSLNAESSLKDAKLLVLDECSMVNLALGTDVLSFGTPILVIGDPGQLSPVSGEGFFTRNAPDVMMTTILRQALENPVIRLAHDVREGHEIPYGDHGTVMKLQLGEIPDDVLARCDQMLVGTHADRRMLNQLMLSIYGFSPDLIYPSVPGVKCIVRANSTDLGVINGQMGVTLDYSKDTRHPILTSSFTQTMAFEPGSITEYGEFVINKGMFDDYQKERSTKLKRSDESFARNAKQMICDFGYAITVHSSQGSQWGCPLVYDTGFLRWNPEERSKWLYTAITRTTDSLFIATP